METIPVNAAKPGRVGQQGGRKSDQGRTPRAQSVYRALRGAFLEQALRPGVKMPEDSIGEELGGSRTLVHDALARLALESMVEIAPNRGATVAYPTLEEARDVFEVRRSLERQVMLSLAGHLNAPQLARLEVHADREDEAHGRNSAESIRLASEFHILLAEMTGNALLSQYVQEVSSRCSVILSIDGARTHRNALSANIARLSKPCGVATVLRRSIGWTSIWKPWRRAPFLPHAIRPICAICSRPMPKSKDWRHEIASGQKGIRGRQGGA
jgi:DNA-binding GntR family transcriptional regulator